MNRLMKAEWLRVRKSSHFTIWIIGICLLLNWMTVINVMPDAEKSGSSLLIMSLDTMFMLISAVLPALTACMVGIHFSNKTAYYEVMAGDKISHIIFSKLVVIGLGVGALFGIVYVGIQAGFCIAYGVGEFDDLALRLALVVIIFLHLSLLGVVIGTALKHVIAPVLGYMKVMMLDSIFMLVLSLIFEDSVMEKISGWFITSQFSMICMHEISNTLVLQIIASAIIDVALWYVLSYIGYKHKTFAK